MFRKINGKQYIKKVGSSTNCSISDDVLMLDINQFDPSDDVLMTDMNETDTYKLDAIMLDANQYDSDSNDVVMLKANQ